ncbi:hypothetical protein B0H17DRAFT_179239 [Mycena rosella]|uniref:Uncharacterized protein n=1 Tax=Mycena rosella TaxID=1033263 RepID=A0AAD7D0Y8_MYCRO|nr:hypothetical protein B0H17DRAFT_179239 [Mycena rosella]
MKAGRYVKPVDLSGVDIGEVCEQHIRGSWQISRCKRCKIQETQDSRPTSRSKPPSRHRARGPLSRPRRESLKDATQAAVEDAFNAQDPSHPSKDSNPQVSDSRHRWESVQASRQLKTPSIQDPRHREIQALFNLFKTSGGPVQAASKSRSSRRTTLSESLRESQDFKTGIIKNLGSRQDHAESRSSRQEPQTCFKPRVPGA